MSVFAEVLAIEVGLKGVEKVQAGLDKISAGFVATEAATASLKSGLAILGVTAAVALAGVREAMPDQAAMAKIEGLTGSMKETEAIMRSIDKVASRGIWHEEEIQTAAATMEKSLGGSFRANIGLLEKLGARMGSISSAAELLAKLNRGQTFGVAMQLGEAGIGPDKLRAAGLDVKGRTINNTPQQIIDALTKIERADGLLSKLQGTLGSTLGAMVYQFKELVQTLGDPLLGPLTAVASITKGVFETMKNINMVTNGWAGKFLVGGALLVGFSKVLVFLREMLTVEKALAIWAGVRSGLQAGAAIIANFGKIVGFLRQMLTLEKAQAAIEAIKTALAAAYAAFVGNWAGLAAGIAIMGGIGYGAYVGIDKVNRMVAGQPDEPASAPPSQRPQRRNDIENLYRHLRGKAWTG